MATLDVTEERRRAIDRVNRAYADEDYDRYERPSSAIVKGSGLTAITVFLKEKKPLRAEWLVHELTDAGKEV